jgi:hypothetical protein
VFRTLNKKQRFGGFNPCCKIVQLLIRSSAYDFISGQFHGRKEPLVEQEDPQTLICDKKRVHYSNLEVRLLKNYWQNNVALKKAFLNF